MPNIIHTRDKLCKTNKATEQSFSAQRPTQRWAPFFSQFWTLNGETGVQRQAIKLSPDLQRLSANRLTILGAQHWIWRSASHQKTTDSNIWDFLDTLTYFLNLFGTLTSVKSLKSFKFVVSDTN